MSGLKIILAQPRGFCGGVERAIDIVERALKKYGPPIYVKHEIVHNKYVVDDLRSRGAIFTDDISEIPYGSITVFSAHGVSKAVEDESRARGLYVIDATCPLVKKVHNEAIRYEKAGNRIILIGHEGHVEVEGTSGQLENETFLVQNTSDVEKLPFTSDDNLSYVTQTTLSVDDTRDIVNALKAKFPNIQGKGTSDVCYATQNRQDAVKQLVKEVNLVFVIGSENSSNSNRLRELSKSCGIPSYLILCPEDINPDWLTGIDKIGITAGASAPELLVTNIIEHFKSRYDNVDVSTIDGIEEDVSFNIPRELRSVAA